MNTMNISYMLYQAERPRSAAEQREANVRMGELAAAIARLGRSLRHALTGTKAPRREGQRPATAIASCIVARPQ
jgi:hypothetical protein